MPYYLLLFLPLAVFTIHLSLFYFTGFQIIPFFRPRPPSTPDINSISTPDPFPKSPDHQETKRKAAPPCPIIKTDSTSFMATCPQGEMRHTMETQIEPIARVAPNSPASPGDFSSNETSPISPITPITPTSLATALQHPQRKGSTCLKLKSLIDEAIEDGKIDLTLKPFMVNPFPLMNTDQRKESMSMESSPTDEQKSPEDERPGLDRAMSREWDASQVRPSQFQRRKGSIYATPSTRDSQKGRDRDQAYHTKLKEKGWEIPRKNSA